jgi:hypothetical protein
MKRLLINIQHEMWPCFKALSQVPTLNLQISQLFSNPANKKCEKTTHPLVARNVSHDKVINNLADL